ncbi:MAG: molybdenum cofactor biosynthesis protein MoaE, partial [Arenicellales bacterium]|nr:molybdenum cofactor biosynthesis protein MoaE [Arenicellales bacterium]
MKIEIRHRPFDPWQELTSYQQTGSTAASSYGATALFVGTMRDFNEGDRVHGMTLEHYPGMTEKHLEAICHNA